MKSIRLIIVCILVWSTVLMAQNFHITDFVPDSVDTWKVGGGLSTSTGISSSTEDYLDSNDSLNYYYEFNSSSFRFSPNASIYSKKIMKDYEFYLSMYGSFEYSKSLRNSDEEMVETGDKVVDYEYDYKRLYGYGRATLNYLKYIQNKIGIGGDVNLYYSKIKTVRYYETYNKEYHYYYNYWRESFDINDDINKVKSYSLNVCPVIQYGRIYDGSYAAKAEEMLIELEQEGLLLRKISKFEFQKLSQLILKRKNQYHYDSRIKRKEDINIIVEYLKSIGAIETDSTPAATTVFDTYLYSSTYTRNFGNRFYVSADLSIGNEIASEDEIDNNKQWIDDSLTNSRYLYSDNVFKETAKPKKIIVGFEHNHIHNYHFWYRFDCNVSYSKNDFIEKDNYDRTYTYFVGDTTYQHVAEYKTIIENRFFTGDLSATFYYQWNSRSVSKLLIGYDQTYRIFKSESDNQYNGTESESESKAWYRLSGLTLSSSLTYYLTPKLYYRLNVSANYDHYSRKIKDEYRDYAEDEFSASCSLSLYWTL